MRLTASIVLTLLTAFIAVPAWAQTPSTEADLEQLSRKIALDAAKIASFRWPPRQFPLRVAFDAGPDLKARTHCLDQWQQNYDEYVQFINSGPTLLLPTAVNRELDAYVFYGSDAEVDTLPAYRLHQTWMWKPGISVQWQNLDRLSHSYMEAYGTGTFVEFSGTFAETTPESLVRCRTPAEDVSGVLLPGYVATIWAQAHRLFNGQPPATLKWRAERRLLLAMTRLPEEDLTPQLLKLSLIRELTHD